MGAGRAAALEWRRRFFACPFFSCDFEAESRTDNLDHLFKKMIKNVKYFSRKHITTKFYNLLAGVKITNLSLIFGTTLDLC